MRQRAEEHIGDRFLVVARPRDPLAMPTVSEEPVCGYAALGVLGNVFC